MPNSAFRLDHPVTRLLLWSVVLTTLLDSCLASHFRGAHFWWYPTSKQNQIRLAFRIAWRRDYSESTYCDAETLEQGELMGPVDAGYIMCSTNCDFNVGNMEFYCTDFSPHEDWAAGVREHNVTLPAPGPYQLSWRGRSWLEEVIRDLNIDWEFLIGVNTIVRQDTTKVNSSPRSAATTVLRLQQGCHHSVSIPVYDADNDLVWCRWAVDKECGGICGAPENIQLSRETCTLVMSNQLTEGLYGLAIQIEDFSLTSGISPQPLSSVPLQFLVNVTSTPIGQSTANQIICSLGPVFIKPTPDDQQCIPLLAGREESLEIVARTKDAFTGIKEINTASFLGVNKTKVERYGTDPRDFYVTITWYPDNDNEGDRIFCFVAIDINGYSSEQRCIYVSVGISSPQAISAEYRPVEHEIIIEFDQKIQMPRGSHELVVEDETGSRVVVLDTSNTAMVSYTDVSLIANLQRNVMLQGNYSIKLQSGAVRGRMRCGPDSLAVTDSEQLSFTAPIVTTENPGFTVQTPNLTVSMDTENSVSTSHNSKVTGTKATITDLIPDSTVSIRIIDNTMTSSANEPPGTTKQTPGTAASTDDDRDYVWLIIVIVVVLVLLLLLIILAIVCQRRMSKQKYSRKHRQEEYLKTLPQTKVVGYDGPYAPNFHDIEVKFR